MELTTYQPAEKQDIIELGNIDFSIERQSLIVQYIANNLTTTIFNHKTNKRTVESYINEGRHFLNFVEQYGFPVTALENYIQHMNRVVSEKTGNPLSSSTKSKRAKIARIMVKRVAAAVPGIIPANMIFTMTEYLDYPKTTMGNKRQGLNSNDITLIENYLNNLEPGIEKEMFICQHIILKYQGLRARELAEVHVEDFDFNSRSMDAICKGSEEKKPFPLFTEAAKGVKKYLKYSGIESGRLFPDSFDRFKMSKKWRVILKLSGVRGKKLHDYRHWVGGWVAVKSNGDILAVKQALRHKDIKTSQIYIDEWAMRESFNNLDEIATQEKQEIHSPTNQS